MGFLSNLFKSSKPSKRKLQLHLVTLKNTTKNIKDLYVGQIVSISTDYKENRGIIDENSVKYNLISYPQNIKIGTLRSSDEEYGEKFSYAILKEISENNITACIICNDVYLNRFKVFTNVQLNNGEVLEVKKDNQSYKLKKDNVIIANITDNRINDELLNKTYYFSYDNGCIVALISK